ncbi:hypothetical protein TNCV_1541871 [Trichonephila clavipes]|nr:hypothetical protein TNCV_1541871 [Trichonephila clavipes]
MDCEAWVSRYWPKSCREACCERADHLQDVSKGDSTHEEREERDRQLDVLMDLPGDLEYQQGSEDYFLRWIFQQAYSHVLEMSVERLCEIQVHEAQKTYQQSRKQDKMANV